jgi:hypothetical protein
MLMIGLRKNPTTDTVLKKSIWRKSKMRKMFATMALFGMLLVGCADSKRLTISKGTYEFKPVGLFSMSEKNPEVNYEVFAGNVFWGVVLCETVVVPVVLLGWRLYEPKGTNVPEVPGATR